MASEAVVGKKKSMPLWIQILIGVAIGVVIGLVAPEFGKSLQPIGTAFIKAIKMIVMPLVFSAVTLGISKMGKDMKKLGKLGGIAFLWFYAATGFAVVLGITLSMIFQPGAGVNLNVTTGVTLPAHLGKGMNWVNFFLDIIPDNIINAMANQKIIPTLFFAICFGLCLGKMDEEKSRPMTKWLESLMEGMFKLTHGIVSTSPIAVTGIIAWCIATQKGNDLLFAMAKLVGVMYIGLVILAAVFLFVIKLLGESPIAVLKKVSEPVLLAFTTASSEVTLPVHMDILERSGIPNRVVSFVLPLGYSFNLDGAALGQSLYICFLAQAYNLHLDMSSLITILVTTLIANKGTANVPAASLVVVATILTSLGLPLDAIAILMAIDRFMDMGRTAANVFGNTVAAILLYKIDSKSLDAAAALNEELSEEHKQ